MKLSVYKEVLNRLGDIIHDSEFMGHVYSVGGCERDRLLGYDIKDIDLVVDLPNGGIRLANWLFEHDYLTHAPVVYENYGTAMFHLISMPDIELEAVQTRKESYRDMTTRNPETAYGTIHEDCMRRDFTMNALYRTVGTDELHDFTGRSLKDIGDKIIRSCDNPDIIFNEDPLRILRAIRFSAKLGWSIEEQTFNGMIKNSERLEIISRERITDEFNKILGFEYPSGPLFKMFNLNILKYVCSQFGSISREDFNDAVHSMRWTGKKHLSRLAILMMHVEDPELAMREMKYSIDDIRYVMLIIKEVPIVSQLGKTYKDINLVELRKQQYRIGDFKIHNNIIEIAHSINNKDCAVVRKNMQAMHVMAMCIKLMRDGTSCYGYKLPVNGEDVMKIKGIGPGKEIKQCLTYLMEEAFKNTKITKEECINLIKKYDVHGK